MPLQSSPTASRDRADRPLSDGPFPRSIISLMSVGHKTYRNSGNAQVLARIPSTPGLALDVGCGAGDNASQLVARGWQVDGITLSANEAEIAQRVCRKVYLHNLENGLPSALLAQYDLVICSHVLEHICFPAKLLADIRIRIGEQGRFIVALPNLLWWKNRLKLLRGRFEYTQAGLMDNTHFRWYTFASAQRMLSESGFQLLEAVPDGGIPLSFLRQRLPRWSFRWADSVCQRHAPGLIAYQMIFVATIGPTPQAPGA